MPIGRQALELLENKDIIGSGWIRADYFFQDNIWLDVTLCIVKMEEFKKIIKYQAVE